MTQHEDLELLRALAAREQHNQLKQPADDHVNDRHDQERPPQDGLPTLPRPQQAAPVPAQRRPNLCTPRANQFAKSGAIWYSRARVKQK